MGFIHKAFNFVASPTHSRTAAILVLLILFAAVPLTVFISQKQQQLKQRASGQNCEANYTSCTDTYNECNQNCSSLAQSDYGTYDEYTQAYYSCTDQCSNDQSKCNTDAYNVYLQCFSSADSNSTSSVNPSVSPTSEEQTSTLIPTPTPTIVPQCDYNVSPDGCNNSSKFCFEGTCVSCTAGFFNRDQTQGCEAFSSQPVIPTSTPIPVAPTSVPSKIPTLTPTAVPTFTPTIVSTQVISPTPSIPTPSPVPYCYLKSKGDADCDDLINILDFELWRTEFVGVLKGIPIINKPSDFNSDGVINIVDFNIWKTSFGDPSLPH